MSQNHPVDDHSIAIPHPDRGDAGGPPPLDPRPRAARLSPSTGGRAVKWHGTARVVVGMVLILLGLLWILQGADVVRIRPILCLANCQPITGGSPLWLAIGVVTSAVGLRVVGVLRRRR
jgi:hypothetical protein